MTNSEVHQYDSDTGVYLKTFPKQGEAEKELGLYRGAIYEILNRKSHQPGQLIFSRTKYEIHPAFVKTIPAITTEIPSPALKPAATITEEQLRQKHDMFFMISSYINKIPDGRFVEETQMLRDLGLMGKPRYREPLGRPELRNNRGKVDGTVYYGPEESIKKLKQEGVLQ